MNEYKYCDKCKYNVSLSLLTEYEGVEGWMYHCPVCENLLITVPYTKEELEEQVEAAPAAPPEPKADYTLTADEIRYTLHALGKQLTKVENAQKRLYASIGKLEIQLEIALENERETN